MQLSLLLVLLFCVGLPDLKKVVVIPYARSKQDTDLSKIPNRCVMTMRNAQVHWLKPILTVKPVFCADFLTDDRLLPSQRVYRRLPGFRPQRVGSAAPAGVRAASVQPSTVHHVFLWHHGRSEMHGPLCWGEERGGFLAVRDMK